MDGGEGSAELAGGIQRAGVDPEGGAAAEVDWVGHGAAGVTRLAEEDAGCGVVSGVSSSSSEGGRGVARARASGTLGGTSGTSGAATGVGAG